MKKIYKVYGYKGNTKTLVKQSNSRMTAVIFMNSAKPYYDRVELV